MKDLKFPIQSSYAIIFISGDRHVGIPDGEFTMEFFTEFYDVEEMENVRSKIKELYSLITEEGGKVTFDFELEEECDCLDSHDLAWLVNNTDATAMATLAAHNPDGMHDFQFMKGFQERNPKRI